MLKKTGYILVALILCLTTSGAFAQHSFTVNAPAVVAGGEVFSVSFTANSDVSNFQGPTFTGATVLAGPTQSYVRSTQITNGRRTSSKEITYNYVLQANESGQVSIGPAKATIDGNIYSTRQHSIDIVKGESSGQSQNGGSGASSDYGNTGGDAEVSYDKADVFLRLSLNKTKVVKGEPLVATLKIYTRNNIMGFEDIHFPVFNGFWSQEIETHQNIAFVREKVGDRIYSSAVLRKYMLIPQQSGNLTIDAAELVTIVQVMSRPRRNRSIFDDFFDSDTSTQIKKKLTSGTHKVVVSNLPANAPESFGGGVGKFSMSARVTKDSLRSNEAASLIVELSGSGNLNLINAPEINFPNDFEKYDVKATNNFTNGADGVSGKKIFEFPFIPRSEGDYVIPEINYSYYDIDKKQYVTLTNPPIGMRVEKGNSAVSTSYVPSADKRKVSNIDEDIRYISNAAPKLSAQGNFMVGSWRYYVAVAFLIAAYFGLKRILEKRIALKGDVLRSRNKKANKVVRSRLRLAGTFLNQNKVQEFYEELHKALLGYVSDKLFMQFSDMQRDTIEETLKSHGVDENDIKDFISLLDDCEMVRYSPEGAAGAMDSQYKKAADVISAFEVRL